MFLAERTERMDILTDVGREFHARDAATGSAWSPRVDRRVSGKTSVDIAADQRCCSTVITAMSLSYGKMETVTPVKFKPLNRLSPNLPQLIMSVSRHYKPNLVKNPFVGTSGQMGEIPLSCDFFIYHIIQARCTIQASISVHWLAVVSVLNCCDTM